MLSFYVLYVLYSKQFQLKEVSFLLSQLQPDWVNQFDGLNQVLFPESMES